VKPKAFIGSSGETSHFADAIHEKLRQDAECTPWTAGAFDLGESTLEGLMRNLRESDFGIFIFGADDATTKRDSLLKSPRDNVVFEAGLFSGYLGTKRCFIAVPQDTKVHLPSDLSGITVGIYEDNRGDGNDAAAVNTFSIAVRKRIREQGLFQGTPRDQLRDLVVQFESCSWITDEPSRVEKKREIAAHIEAFSKTNPLNKQRLLAQNHPGYVIALVSAIRFRPERRDWELIKNIKLSALPPGFAYYKLMTAVEALKETHNIAADELRDLQEWLKGLPSKTPDIQQRVDSLFP
jgi:hypothetical protein